MNSGKGACSLDLNNPFPAVFTVGYPIWSNVFGISRESCPVPRVYLYLVHKLQLWLKANSQQALPVSSFPGATVKKTRIVNSNLAQSKGQ